jgi:hypothetical protein
MEKAPMPISIRQTVVTPGDGHDVVQLRISDVPLGDESGSLDLTIVAKFRGLRTPALAHLQRETMKIAQDALTLIQRDVVSELQDSGYGTEVSRRKPPT